MLKKLYWIGLFIFLSFSAFSKVAIIIERNVSRSDIPADDAFVKEEKEINKIIADYHGGKNCTIKINFIDPSPYPSYIQWLVDWWNSVVGEEQEKPSDIEILFSLNENDKWKYEGIKIKPTCFFKNYYLEKVQEYVKEHIWEGVKDDQIIVARWLNIIKNVLDQQWKQKLLTEGSNLINVAGYNRGHQLYFCMGAKYNYNLEPYSIDSTLTKNAGYIYNLNEAEGHYLETINSYFDKFDYHNPYETINELKEKIWKKVRDREDYNKKLPAYELADTKIKTDSSFHLKNRDERTKRYRLKFTKTPVNENEEYNFLSDLIAFGWEHTSCNYFAFDLQKKVWGKFLWSYKTAQASKAIYNYLPSDPNFKEVPIKEASKYAEHGFYVICSKPGHITTLYPDGMRNPKATDFGHVVQAGGKKPVKDVYLNQIFDELNIDTLKSDNKKIEIEEPAKAYVYLEYIFN